MAGGKLTLRILVAYVRMRTMVPTYEYEYSLERNGQVLKDGANRRTCTFLPELYYQALWFMRLLFYVLEHVQMSEGARIVLHPERRQASIYT